MSDTHNIIIKQKVEFAIKNHKLCKFSYVSKDMSVTQDRLVEPICLLPLKSTEPNRFAANDLDKDSQRIFSFEGVQNLRLIDYEKAYLSEGL